MKRESVKIGPSIGRLFAQGIYDLTKHQKFLDEAKANAAELAPFLDEERRQESLIKGERLDVDFVTLHLWDYQTEKPLEEQASMAKAIFSKHQAKIAVMHPLGLPAQWLSALANAGIAAAIENMDKPKSGGYLISELRALMEDFDLKFVLDLQHAFEHDASMTYAWDLFQMAGAKLTHLHVSGQNKQTVHSLVHLADNAFAIVNLLGKIFSEKKFPIILEGKYVTAFEVKTEINFLKKELGL